MVAAEALARWQHPRHGLLGPATFVPAAEATGQVVAIDRVVLEHACRAAAAWDGLDGRPPAGAAVHANLSGVGLRSFEIVAEVEAVLESSGLRPLAARARDHRERADRADVPIAVRTLNALRDLGVRIALDDFGTGHSSLQSLRELPVDIIKVAKPFVDGAARTAHDKALMRMMVDLAALFGIEVVAEGIEREDQLAALRELGCGIGQGYLLGRPVELAAAGSPRRAAACGSLHGMSKLNASEMEFEYDAEDPEGFRAGMKRFGKKLGAAVTGMSIYEIPPGQAICPYHYEYAEEEWLVVLEGTPTLRTPEGSSELAPWDVCVFPVGPSGAHGVRNEGSSVARVMMFSEVKWPAATVYPDSDKIGVWTGNDDDSAMFRRATKVEYYTDEPGL